jgi:hypothetical protein
MSVPLREWTDDEWIRAMREFKPDTPGDVVEAAVARWRQEAQQEGERHEQ